MTVINDWCVLTTGVLNDDFVRRIKDKWELVYYTYANEWSNHEHIEEFDTLDEALAFYKEKYMGRLEAEAEYQSEQNKEEINASDILDSVCFYFEGVEG